VAKCVEFEEVYDKKEGEIDREEEEEEREEEKERREVEGGNAKICINILGSCYQIEYLGIVLVYSYKKKSEWLWHYSLLVLSKQNLKLQK